MNCLVAGLAFYFGLVLMFTTFLLMGLIAGYCGCCSCFMIVVVLFACAVL